MTERTQGIAEAARRLAAGELVAFPTETVYGLGARADDEAAVAAIFRRKGRPENRPLLVHLAAADDLHTFAADVPDAACRLADAFWPGPLALVLPVRRGAVAPSVLAGGRTVGLRLPDHPVARGLAAALAERVGRPVGIAAPSANPSGAPPPKDPDAVVAGLGPGGYTLLDAGPCPGGVPSTVVEVLPDGDVLVHRPGAIPRKALARALPPGVRLRSPQDRPAAGPAGGR